MALLEREAVERWIAVAAIALGEARRRGEPLESTLARMAKLPGWPGRVAWLLLTDRSRLALVLEWIKSGVKPKGSLAAYVARQFRQFTSH
ncbi:hypothetical protein [Stetteria hydrogenophila]